MELYNTLEKKVVPFVPLKERHVSLYTCGPTIYDVAHIGNFRTYVAQDVLKRALLYAGYSVTHVMNLTDIDDKTIRGAIAKGCSLTEYTAPFGKAFCEDLKALAILRPDQMPKATESIADMIELIQTLLDRHIAYRAENGSIYYSIANFPHYGRLSCLPLDTLKINASGENEADEYGKEAAADFVLWKSYDPSRDGDIFFESPFGRGRPGWHIECSAMAMRALGPTIDIHGGGVDLLFPHHENEIAQSEGCTGKPFVRYWFHVHHLLVDHKKMSKSLGNFYTFRDLVKEGYSPSAIRYLLLSTHYRMELQFSLEALKSAKAALHRINAFISRLQEVKGAGELDPFFSPYEKGFFAAIFADLNIAEALSFLFEAVRHGNTLIDEGKMSRKTAEETIHLFSRFDQILGCLSFEKEAIPEEIKRLVAERQEAREQRDWKRSDLLRQAILEKGYSIEDTAEGAKVDLR